MIILLKIKIIIYHLNTNFSDKNIRVHLLSIVTNILLYTIHNISHILIRHIGAGRQAQPDLKQRFAHPIHVSRAIFIDRLLMHRLPQRAGFYTHRIKSHTHRLNIGIRLAIRMCVNRCVSHTARTTNSTLYRCLISILLPFHPQ